ncbi:hypothetical protein niasHT_025152 [Heterodera trifolii]|uniref:Uncharacterized protein n=1 Tax=Heterodera trifolii TaxID=157864 RepID=A0ABD2JLF5_9BILA
MSRRKCSSIAPSLFGVARCGECHSARCRACESVRERNKERMRMGLPYGRISREFGPLTLQQMLLAITARNPLEAAQQEGRETRGLFRGDSACALSTLPNFMGSVDMSGYAVIV